MRPRLRRPNMTASAPNRTFRRPMEEGHGLSDRILHHAARTVSRNFSTVCLNLAPSPESTLADVST